jgi:hypothetical protein
MKTSAALQLPLLMVSGVALLALPNVVDCYVALAISALYTSKFCAWSRNAWEAFSPPPADLLG